VSRDSRDQALAGPRNLELRIRSDLQPLQNGLRQPAATTQGSETAAADKVSVEAKAPTIAVRSNGEVEGAANRGFELGSVV